MTVLRMGVRSVVSLIVKNFSESWNDSMFSLRAAFGDDATVLRDTDFELLLIANVVAPLGIAVISPMLSSLVDPLGATPSSIGLIMSVYSAPAVILILIAGYLIDAYGRKPLIVGGLVMIGGGGLAIPLTADFQMVLGFRVLQGFGFAALMPSIITSIGDIYQGTEEVTAQGFRFTVSGISQTVFPVLSGVLVTVAWQYPFFLYAISIPIAGLVYRYFEEPMDQPSPSRNRNAASNGNRTHVLDLLRLVRQPRVASYLAARSLPPAAYIGFMTYNSLIVVELIGGTPRDAGFLVALSFTFNATAASQAGRIAATFDRRLYPLLGANAAVGVGLVVVALAHTLLLAAIGSVALGLGIGVLMSLYRSIITGLAPETLRGGLVSIGESAGMTTITAVPIVMGLAIGFLAPSIGLPAAVRWASIGTGVGAAGLGALATFIASLSPPVIAPRES